MIASPIWIASRNKEDAKKNPQTLANFSEPPEKGKKRFFWAQHSTAFTGKSRRQ